MSTTIPTYTVTSASWTTTSTYDLYMTDSTVSSASDTDIAKYFTYASWMNATTV